MTEPAADNNGQHEAKKMVDGKFVDMEIFDDHVIICGHKIERKKSWNVDVKTWRMQWEFLRKKLAARGPMATANHHGPDEYELFQKMVNRTYDEDPQPQLRPDEWFKRAVGDIKDE